LQEKRLHDVAHSGPAPIKRAECWRRAAVYRGGGRANARAPSLTIEQDLATAGMTAVT